MKKIFLFVSCCFTILVTTAQSFEGIWEGRLETPVSLRLAFTFTAKADGSFKATWQSPDQTRMVFPTDKCLVKNDSIYLTAKKFGISFKGKLTDLTTISGVFTQGKDFSLVLKKVNAVVALKRPQTPVPPFNYNSKEVSYYNSDSSIRFSGTLTWPKMEPGVDYFRKPIYPAAILISGSGPQDRDETIFEHKPFAVLADYLTNKGFAVLRTDDRGVGKTTGNFATATTADFARDTETALDFLKKVEDVDTAHIGLIGHSEGGMIAPMVASKRKDVHFVVLMAGPGIPIATLMEEQITAVALSQGEEAALVKKARESYSIITKEIVDAKDSNLVIRNATSKIEKWAALQDSNLLTKMKMNTSERRKEAVQQQVMAMTGPWFKYFIGFNPKDYLQKLSCNVLAINGSKDIQVLPASNLEGIRAALKGSKSAHYDIVEIKDLNHLFQSCTTCTVKEYAELEESLSPKALEIIGNWLLQYGR
jgi:uncharacterized protein